MFQQYFDRLFRDKSGHIVISQWPNPPLWTWIACTLLRLVVHGTVHLVVSAIGTLALLVWAGLELARGRSLFRRLAGGVVGTVVLASLVRLI